MKPNTTAVRSAIVKQFLLTLLLFFTCSKVFTQQPARLRPEVYKNFIRPDIRVSVKTIDRGMIRETNTATLSTFQVPVEKKQVINYDNAISSIDKSSFEKLKPKLPPAALAEDIKIIPELHVEPIGGGQTEAVAYRILFTLQQPLHYDENLKKYTAELGFLLMSESGNNTPPAVPVDVEIAPGESVTVDRRALQIKHLSIPSEVVKIVAGKVKDSIAVKVMTTSNPQGYITYLKVQPLLKISSNRSTMQGFGIQETPIIVRFVGSNSPDSVQVDLSAEKGTITPNPVYVPYNRSKMVYLRSEGLGKSKITAISHVADSNDLHFKFVFPWLFLLAAIFGGLSGSLAKYFLGVKEKGSPLKPIIGGILIGLIGAVAYYGLGVSLIGINLSVGMHELAVFAISALGAYFGISPMKLDGKK